MTTWSNLSWKSNWEDTRRRYIDWWNRKGVLIGMWGAPETDRCVHEQVPRPAVPATIDERYTDPGFRAAQNHHRLACSEYPADVLPLAVADLGPGSLALLAGSQPSFAEDTVWFFPCIEDVAEPESLPPLAFDPANPWWTTTERILKACAGKGRGRYVTGCPDLVENMDVLASLRGGQTLLVDLVDRPEWVERKVWEINQLWFDAYDRIYELIKLEDGSAAYGAFYLWGPGKTAKLQCDASAAFSPAMYRRFVAPALAAQCEWLDFSLYHLDGTQAMIHLDTILSIEALDAIEWTPQAGIEPGGHRRWYDLYRRILKAGKSVQVVGVEHDDVVPLLDAIGTDGVYLMTTFTGETDASRLLDRVSRYR
ncbi:MAG TPA: hypothetical protein VHE61_19330 [Opitutaceae bacterium]|nr:hypothetical protein [Opitutaceae bacterium]